ncbi:MAG: nitrous oxide reductase accessory protein NosL [Gemmatimonadaceae bacterium]|nr:nitrous oxide reductase accessory protein NosL [Gemmatimonadaceae bacterium]
MRPLNAAAFRHFLALALGAALLAGCQRDRGPRPLIVGEDSCDFCKMAISDTRYGAEVRTTTGRIVTFDAVECLAGYVAQAGDTARFEGIWVADFNGSGMVPATDARFLLGGSLHSPMGRQVTSFAANVSPAELVAKYGGEVLTWEQVRSRVAAPPQGASAMDSMSHGAMSHDSMAHDTMSHDTSSHAH